MKKLQGGFTLIELSIVLVIIGLIVGGILVGQDLVNSAYIRAQITQIEKYNTAVNTFYGKYQALPGDMNTQVALANGFAARGTSCSGQPCAGQGDGNGIIQGSNGADPGGLLCQVGAWLEFGETAMFWRDLAKTGLIEGSFSQAAISGTAVDVWPPGINAFMPEAKLGSGNYVYVWSGGPDPCNVAAVPGGGANGINYYEVAVIRAMSGSNSGKVDAMPGMTVQQAYRIDSKIDDGFPWQGRVQTLIENAAWGQVTEYAATSATPSASPAFGDWNYADPVPASVLTCDDNGNVASTIRHYSTAFDKGNHTNCALSFQFQ